MNQHDRRSIRLPVYLFGTARGCVVGHAAWRRLEGLSVPLGDASMHDPASELLRIALLSTDVKIRPPPGGASSIKSLMFVLV